MLDLKTIKHIMDLEEERSRLKETIYDIEQEKSELQEKCDRHLKVYLGYYWGKTSLEYVECCPLCGLIKTSTGYIGDWKREHTFIHANDYLPHIDLESEFGRKEKFENIQMLVLEIIYKNPNITYDELFARLNHIIRKSIAKEKADITKKSK